MRKLLVGIALTIACTTASSGLIQAQQNTGIDPKFSNQILPTLGYQTMVIEALDDGFEIPSTIESGYTSVTLTSLPDSASYALFVQPEEGIEGEELAAMALQSAAEDIAHEGWNYAGGSYAIFGESAHFLVNLTQGEWQIAASYMIGEGEEIMTMHPLTVTESTQEHLAPEAALAIEHNDTEFIIPDQDVSAGSQIYEFTNVGDAPRQMVLWSTPRELTVEDYQAFFASFDSGTPGPDVMSRLVWVGYHAIISPGQTVWLELDLDPGIYSTTSWIIDPETGAPALLLGMVDNFEVTES